MGNLGDGVETRDVESMHGNAMESSNPYPAPVAKAEIGKVL